jgi:hypothetical protein
MKQFFKSPMFNVLLLAFYVITLIDKLKGISHVYATNAISTHSYFGTGYNWGYKAGYMAAIAVWMIAIVLMSVKIITGKPALSFIKK